MQVNFFNIAAPLLLCAVTSAYARIINIPEDFQTIQNGISAADAGDTVLIQPGIYNENLNFAREEIVVGSLLLTTGDVAYIDSTIIDGNARDAVVSFTQRDITQELRGVTIRNGLQQYGGGIDCQGAVRPRLIDLHVTHNTGSELGGGIYCTHGARPIIENCLVDSNSAGTYGGAGLMAYYESYVTIRNSQFIGNQMPNSADGGTILIWDRAGLEMDSVEIFGNSSRSASGLGSFNADSVILRSCVFRDNYTSDYYHGGADIYDSEVVLISDCFFLTNDPDGRFEPVRLGIGTENENGFGGNILVERTVIHSNSPATRNILAISNCRGVLNNLTLVDVPRQNSSSVYIGESEVTVRNSIFWISGNQFTVGGYQFGDIQPTLNLDYCDITGGAAAIVIVGDEGQEPQLNIGENVLNEDPNFADIENGDFHLQVNSPCIDAGDPNFPLDSDHSRSDIGAYPFIYRGAWVGGRIVDSRSAEPIIGAEFVSAEVMIHDVPVIFTMKSDSAGNWGGWLNHQFEGMLSLDFSVMAAEHSPYRFNVELTPEESVWLEIRMTSGGLELSMESLVLEADSNQVSAPVTLHNTGDGALIWSTAVHSVGESGAAPMTERRRFSVTQTTGDDRIEGVVFTGDHFYCSGAAGADSSQIYVLDHDGNLLRSFPQLSHSRYGMKDLEWDGELIWGAGDSKVYGFTPEGDSVIAFDGPFSPTNCIAYDSDQHLLWLSATTSNIEAYDRTGRRMDRQLTRKNLRIYGLSYWSDDPDGYQLYILTNDGQANSSLYKMNTETGDTLLVSKLQLGQEGVPGGAFICRDFDQYRCNVFGFINNVASANGGDQVVVMQLSPNNEWLSVEPANGELPAGESREITVSCRTFGADGDWAFDYGDYDGEIVLSHDGIGRQQVLPVHLSRRIADSKGEIQPQLPGEFGLTGAFPNPFNSIITIQFSVGQVSKPVRLAVYGVDGRLVEELWTGRNARPTQNYSVTWNADRLPGGVYLVRLESGNDFRTIKAVLIK